MTIETLPTRAYMLNREWISQEVQCGCYGYQVLLSKEADDHKATPLLATGYYVTLTYLLKENDQTMTKGR